MSNLSLKLNAEQIQKLKNTFKEYIQKSPNEYIDTFIKKDDLVITIYKSSKVVFQGKDAFYYGSSFFETKINRQAGSDEVGTGDLFGPICVCACIVEVDDFKLLEELQVTDSKEIKDEKIVEIAPLLMKELKHTLLILENQKYNEVHKQYNMNVIKAMLHNQAYLNLIKKGYELPTATYVDEFAAKELYFSYLKDQKEVYHDLIFETKAESKYPAVAAASVIARYAFISKMKEMEKKYKTFFHKGAGELADQSAQQFVALYGKERLNEVAKLNFKNIEKL